MYFGVQFKQNLVIINDPVLNFNHLIKMSTLEWLWRVLVYVGC